MHRACKQAGMGSIPRPTKFARSRATRQLLRKIPGHHNRRHVQGGWVGASLTMQSDLRVMN
eukprot:11155144-Lingulodinium_polyedra.AAC.1